MIDIIKNISHLLKHKKDIKINDKEIDNLISFLGSNSKRPIDNLKVGSSIWKITPNCELQETKVMMYLPNFETNKYILDTDTKNFVVGDLRNGSYINCNDGSILVFNINDVKELLNKIFSYNIDHLTENFMKSMSKL